MKTLPYIGGVFTACWPFTVPDGVGPFRARATTRPVQRTRTQTINHKPCSDTPRAVGKGAWRRAGGAAGAMPANQMSRQLKEGFKLTEEGVKKTFWFHLDEAEALRRTAFERRMKESEIVRQAVRRFLKIED